MPSEAPQTVIDPPKIPDEKKATPETNGWVSRDAWLAQAGKFKEKEVPVEGLGKVLIVEISGAARAAIQSAQSTGLLSDVKRIDSVAYQRALLLSGVADPSSPEGARQPLFKAADMDRVMQIGGAKIALLVDEIEKLSGMGAEGESSAEGNSPATPSAAGTS